MILKIKKFQQSFTHLEQVKYALRSRGMHKEIHDISIELPQIGYIVEKDSYAVASGFLRVIEGNVAMLDSLVTHADCTPVDRDTAIDMVVQALISKAKELNIKQIIAFSRDKNTLERSLRHGFVRQDHAFIALDLSGE